MSKIFPWLKNKEEEEEREFYALRGIDLKPEYALEESVGGRVHHAQLQRAGISSSGNNMNDSQKVCSCFVYFIMMVAYPSLKISN